MNDYGTFAADLAYKAGKIIRKNFRLGMKKKAKEKDTSPVTIFDTKINRLVIEAIKKAFPHHSVVGEEESSKIESEYTWFCDPIDGTTPFTSGVPLSTFSLALTKDSRPILGVIYDPYMDRLFFGEKGKGAYLNKKKISVSKDSSLIGQPLHTGWWKYSLYDLGIFRRKLSNDGVKVMDFQCFTYAGTLVAAGEFTAVVFGDRFPWDVAAVNIIVEEAGGRCTDFSGKIPTYDKEINGFIASNGSVHNQLLNLVKKFAIKKT